MRFALSEQAAAVGAGLREALARACPPEVVRGAWPGGDAAPVGKLWNDLADVGLFGLLVPGEAGGLGLDELHLVAALEEVGYVGAPGPVLETVAFTAPLLAAAGETALAADVVAGRVTVTARLGPAGGPVPYAQTADLALVGDPADLRLVALTGGTVAAGTGGNGSDGARATVTPVASVDGSRRLGTLGGGGRRLGVDPAAVERAAERAALGSAAVLVGLARRMLDLTVSYVKDREQFGRPVGSFQAVQHLLADALLGIEFARPPVLRAAWSLATDDKDAPIHVSMAKALAADAATAVVRAALQAHGAMGYTVEYDLHLFAKRVWAVAHDWGGPADHRERVAAYLQLPAERSTP